MNVVLDDIRRTNAAREPAHLTVRCKQRGVRRYGNPT